MLFEFPSLKMISKSSWSYFVLLTQLDNTVRGYEGCGSEDPPMLLKQVAIGIR